MSVKVVALYGGFFVGVFMLALVVTGTFQQGILPRVLARGGAPAGEAHQAKPADGPPAAKAEPTASETARPTTPPQSDTAPAEPPKAPAAVAGEAGAQVKRLARMYEGMRPKEAAAVMEKLDRSLAALVLTEIRERQAAKILGAMSPAAAADLTRMVGQAPEKAS
jgi:hypothetical protein